MIENISQKKIEKLFLNENKIHKIENLNQMSELRLLEIGSNKIKKIENLEENTKLEELWMGRNKIKKIEKLEKLTNLRILSLQDNLISKLSGEIDPFERILHLGKWNSNIGKFGWFDHQIIGCFG